MRWDGAEDVDLVMMLILDRHDPGSRSLRSVPYSAARLIRRAKVAVALWFAETRYGGDAKAAYALLIPLLKNERRN
jgi:hypothetical protein